jgi:hypothetical protein
VGQCERSHEARFPSNCQTGRTYMVVVGRFVGGALTFLDGTQPEATVGHALCDHAVQEMTSLAPSCSRVHWSVLGGLQLLLLSNESVVLLGVLILADGVGSLPLAAVDGGVDFGASLVRDRVRASP